MNKAVTYVLYCINLTLSYIKEYGLLKTITKIFQKIYSKIRRWLVTKGKMRFRLKKNERQQQEDFAFSKNIKFSILVLLCNTPRKVLREMLESVLKQTYSNWELHLLDCSDSEHAYVGEICSEYVREDSRVRYEHKGMEKIQNCMTIAMATVLSGDYIALLNQNDAIHPSALFENMLVICEKNADLLYSDECKFRKRPQRAFDPFFKPGYAPDTLRSCNYMCRFAVFERKILEKAGGLRDEFYESQNYDLILRLTENANNIVRIAKILYYKRVVPDYSSSEYDMAKMALGKHLKRVKLEGDITSLSNRYRINYQLNDRPLITIIIPNMDYVEDLEKCICSIFEKTTYPNYEIIIVENNSKNTETFLYYNTLKDNEKVKIIIWEDSFNYSSINNFALTHVLGQYVVFLNNDVEIISPNWIEEMLMYAQRNDVGAVGAKLYYPDDTIQHAGIILGLSGIAGHSHCGWKRSSPGYFEKLLISQNMIGVTAACLMVPVKVLREVNGFDESFAVAYNDIDLCMRIRKAGYLIVWTPYAEAYHYESKSRGQDNTPEKQKRFQNEASLFQMRWAMELEEGDPYYNENLTLERADYSVR